MQRIAIMLGTRPEIIKMSPIVRACQRAGAPFFTLHTGQHYSEALDRVFFQELELPAADHNLDIGSGSHGAQTGRMLAAIEQVLLRERPSVVLVEGDTNTVLAGALAAVKLHIPVGHVEAGLRSRDRRMPEEINRVVTDHISELLFAPTDPAREILRSEGIPDERIFVTGNTIVDAVLQNRALAERRSTVHARLGIEPKKYVLMTAHRQENVDHKARFSEILAGARAVGEALKAPVVYPIHPRSRKMLAELGLETAGLILIEPVGVLDFLRLESHAALILTDSGGVQEEACILQIPCVTLRDNTERPETIEAGGNVLAGADAARIVEKAHAILDVPRTWSQPFGDGHAGERILEICQRLP